MTARPNNTIAPDIDSDFDAVAWVRTVRDQMYADTSTLSPEQLIQFVRQAAIKPKKSSDKSDVERRTT